MDSVARTKLILYWFVGLGLSAGYLFAYDSTWQGSVELHTIMEVVATFLAFMVGTMALVRYYSEPTVLYLILGVAFIGTGFLDGYHALVTSH